MGAGWHSQQLSALSLPSNTFLHPCSLPAGSPPASQSPVYFQQKAGGASINRKRVVSGFHQNPQGYGQCEQEKPLDKKFAGQQSKIEGMLAGVSPWDPSAASARTAFLHPQGASIQVRGKLGLALSAPAEPAGDQCVQFWNLKTCNSAMRVHTWASVQTCAKWIEMCCGFWFFFSKKLNLIKASLITTS